MMMRRARIAGAALALVLAVATPAQAVVAAAVPGSYVAGWATPVIVTPVGGPVTVANTDIAPHQLVADGSFLAKKSAKKAPWCKASPQRVARCSGARRSEPDKARKSWAFST